MKRKTKKKISLKLPVLIITFVIMLNFIGISYAYWNDTLQIATVLSTGNIDPLFCDDFSIKEKTGDGEVTVSFEDKYNMTVRGTVYTDYKSFLHYCVVNNGNIPVKFDGKNGTIPITVKGQQPKDKELKIQLNQQAGILYPENKFYSETGNPKLHIDAKNKTPGIYEFEIELPFAQWNK